MIIEKTEMHDFCTFDLEIIMNRFFPQTYEAKISLRRSFSRFFAKKFSIILTLENV